MGEASPRKKRYKDKRMPNIFTCGRRVKKMKGPSGLNQRHFMKVSDRSSIKAGEMSQKVHGCTSISTPSRTICLMVLLFLLTPFTLAAANEYEDALKKLSAPENDVDVFAICGVFLKNPSYSAGLLVSSLHPVNEAKLHSQENSPADYERERPSMGVVWRLRALQYITGGLRFFAPTAYRFPPKPADWPPENGPSSEELRESFLTAKGRDRVPFYVTWMSRDVTYVAPKDVQESVIAKWKEWYSKEGKDYPYGASKELSDWYF